MSHKYCIHKQFFKEVNDRTNSTTNSAAMATQSTPWLLVICGDLPETITVTIPDPCQWTVVQLKDEVEKKTNIPVCEQTLYCGETILNGDSKTLVKYKELRNGIALCLARSNFIIKAERPDYGTTVEVVIPKNDFDSWTTKMLHESICFKFGVPDECKQYLLNGTTVIECDENKIGDHEEITNGCTLIFTPLKEIVLASPVNTAGKRIHVPPIIPDEFLSTTVYNKQPRLTDSEVCAWKGGWSLKIAKAKYILKLRRASPIVESVYLSEHVYTPVFKLREIIQYHYNLAIPAKEQKLTIGEKELVLEDWDDEGRPLLLCNYPTIHDGATINLESDSSQVMHLNIKKTSKDRILIPSNKNLNFLMSPSQHVIPPSSINILGTDKMTLSKLVKIVSYCEGRDSDMHGNHLCIEKTNSEDKLEKTSIIVQDDQSTVYSNKAFIDGCTISTLE